MRGVNWIDGSLNLDVGLDVETDEIPLFALENDNIGGNCNSNINN